MKVYIFRMHILNETEEGWLIELSDDKENSSLVFNPENKKIFFRDNKNISDIIQRNEYQFRKILHNKRKNTFYKGFELKFSILDKKEVLAFNNKENILAVDKRAGNYDVFIPDPPEPHIVEVVTDGCYLHELKKGGMACLISEDGKVPRLKSKVSALKSSCLIELEAAIFGLEQLSGISKIRLITDSQYVKKGITEWIIHWRLNDWHTANGEKAKNIDYWKHLDQLMKGKYIEIRWVKGHGANDSMQLCDQEAKRIAELGFQQC